MRYILGLLLLISMTLFAQTNTPAPFPSFETNESNTTQVENNVSLIDEQKNTPLVEEEKKYNWFAGDEVSPKIYDFIDTIEHDASLICQERLRTDKLRKLIDRYNASHDPMLKEELEYEGNKLAVQYNKIKSQGCFDPSKFLKDNYIRPSKKGIEDIDNPVLLHLYSALAKYKEIEQNGGWEKIEVKDIPFLRYGKRYDVIPQIKKRLKAEGFYPYDDNGTKFDDRFLLAVKKFQAHNGIKVDGVVGPATIDKMNIPVENKIDKILINIERARWFLRNDDYFVFVDIPGFFMHVYDHGKKIFESKVIVGRRKRPTPQMRNVISYAVLNPYWRAPKTIIKEDILPRLQSGDFQHLIDEGIVAATDYNGKNVVDFNDINWSQYSENNLPVIFLQKPGPRNFLGYVKFMFPNRFDVYLHDTNSKRLFRYDFRALSSGCVRVQKPIELFHLLRNHTSSKEVTYRDILDKLWDGKTKRVRFKPIIPVYLLYLTVYEDNNGDVYFFKDIYNLDKAMLVKLRLHKNGRIASN
ncbi:murein L,D-transpeptidase [Nitratiruptor sp. YY09-18]|uniref:L,D-transpeptidase family protein n=1 Tax=Nitratiruptor sp. YY09-18 TaxID=2724901 RepID=UPI001914E17C|nr:L,D-transpeptidase family protein [Nitratiruptor sp. YY09-18]BCD67937.1 L,D-transpeptidase YcbB [Nitratiruptor sp. YY09-18]